MTKPMEEWYQFWMDHHEFQPEKWQVAWGGDKVAGAVQPFINEDENRLFNRKRGYTENIHVGREWRKKGVAKALIARSLHLLKDLGMEEACLGVDAENPTGALHVYQSMGFKEVQRYMTYRKPLE
jgi:ribosomal protein S18 acetylase RimI-like enzyme